MSEALLLGFGILVFLSYVLTLELLYEIKRMSTGGDNEC